MATANVSAAELLLPDLFAWESQALNYMHGGFIDGNSIPSKVLYRFTGALPNQGAGPLEVREVTHPNGTQDVYQRIYDDEASVAESLIGSFPNANPTFGHLWLEGIAQYNLRTVTGVDGVGPIVASQDKTSMALVDGAEYNTSLPGAPPAPVYDNPNDAILGVSVGWADLYPFYLPGQWVEVTGLPSGQYWLEVVADPYNRIQESDESNNTTQIKVTLLIPPPMILLGDYNGNNVIDAADYAEWRDALTAGATELLNDPTPGVVDESDFTYWRAHFGETLGSGSGAGQAAVPEPTSLAMFLMATLAILSRRSRQFHQLVDA